MIGGDGIEEAGDGQAGGCARADAAGGDHFDVEVRTTEKSVRQGAVEPAGLKAGVLIVRAWHRQQGVGSDTVGGAEGEVERAGAITAAAGPADHPVFQDFEITIDDIIADLQRRTGQFDAIGQDVDQRAAAEIIEGDAEAEIDAAEGEGREVRTVAPGAA